MKELRLFFEPKPGTKITTNNMFKHYAGNYLADLNIHYGGYISMNALEKVGEVLEPVYQYIARFTGHTDNSKEIQEYLARNPMEGYYVHAYTKTGNENLTHTKVYG